MEGAPRAELVWRGIGAGRAMEGAPRHSRKDAMTMNSQQPETHQMDSRVSRVEATLSTVQAAIERVETEGQQRGDRLERMFIEQTASLASKIDGISSAQAAGGKTNWSVLIAAVGVVITVLGVVGASWVRPLEVRDGEVARRLDQMHQEDVENRALVLRTFEMAVRAEERGRK